jgi:outer membrane lipoprotein SlyB
MFRVKYQHLPLPVLLAVVLMSGCATTDKISEPIIDRRGVDPYQYEIDLADCGAYADEVASGTKAGAGAVGGAVVGGAVGAIFGGSSGAVEGAGAGAVVGGARGVGDAMRERTQVIKNCLRNRGYAVLN